MMTNQQILDTIIQRFIVEKRKPSFSKELGSCLYSHRLNGCGCFVGCLLDPTTADRWDELDKTEEGTNNPVLIVDVPDPEYSRFFTLSQLTLLVELQCIHDSAYYKENFTGHVAYALASFAKDHNLTFTVPA